jgi:AraC-like DNA-binding protein
LHLYTYPARLTLDGVVYEIHPGYAGLTPAGAVSAYDFPAADCVHLYAHFRPSPIPLGLNTLPLMQDLGARFQSINRALLEAVGWFPTMPARANARLWDVLWQLLPEGAQSLPEPVTIERARHFIERNLARDMAVPRIATYAGCSHNHLVRLFQMHLNTSVVGFIRHRRAERAAYLLRHSNLPIKNIPEQVGVADVQGLNKLVRRELGFAPRAIRSGHEFRDH